MANYVTDLNRMGDLVRECQDTTKVFKGQTPALVVANPANNIFPLYDELGDVLMYVTAYSSTKSTGQFETTSGAADAVLMAVTLTQSGNDTIMTYVGGVTNFDEYDVCQMVFNAAGLRQIAVPSPEGELSRGRPGTGTSGGGHHSSTSHSSHSPGREISSHMSPSERERLKRIRSGVGGQIGESSGFSRRVGGVIRSGAGKTIINYMPKRLVNYLFGILRSQGFWSKSYVPVTNYVAHTDYKVYSSSYDVLFNQCINGAKFNEFHYELTSDEQYMASTVLSALTSHFDILTGYNWWYGVRVIQIDSDALAANVRIEITAFDSSKNPDLRFTCEVNESPAEIRMKADQRMYYVKFSARFAFSRLSVDSNWEATDLDDYRTSSSSTGVGFRIFYAPEGVTQFNSFGISENSIKWVEQDPSVTPPSRDGDTVENTYNEWNIKPQVNIQTDLNPEINFDPYIELKPSISVYLPEDQPTHTESTDGTVINNEGDTVINNNEYITNNIVNNYITNQYFGNPEENVDTNPSTPAQPDTGGPTVPDIADVPAPVAPEFVAQQGNFYNIYFPTALQIRYFNEWLWSANIWDTLVKFFTNPMQAIMSFGMIFVDPTSTENVEKIALGNVSWDVPGTIMAARNQFVTLNCGSVKINHYFNSAMDYEPFTTVGAYLPFIGEVQWSASDVMDSTVSIIYEFDLVTGAGLCTVYVEKTTGTSGNIKAPLYMYDCNCLVTIPLSQSDFSRVYAAIASAAVGATLGLASTAASSAVSSAGRARHASPALSDALESQRSVSNAGTVADAVGNIMGNATIPVTTMGHLGSVSGAMGPKVPYIIVKRRNPYMPEGYQYYQGFPSNSREFLFSLSGFTRVKEVHVHGIPATQEELNMIETILKGGVIL